MKENTGRHRSVPNRDVRERKRFCHVEGRPRKREPGRAVFGVFRGGTGQKRERGSSGFLSGSSRPGGVTRSGTPEGVGSGWLCLFGVYGSERAEYPGGYSGRERVFKRLYINDVSGYVGIFR